MTLFASAIETIQIGVEDLLRNDDWRVLSAVRNLHAGVLLLRKEKLRRLSPDDEILLAQRFELQPNDKGEVSIEAVGRNTVQHRRCRRHQEAFQGFWRAPGLEALRRDGRHSSSHGAFLL